MLQEAPTADGHLEELESRVAEVEVQNRRREKRQVEAEKEFVKEKHGKEHAMFYADSFASGLIYTLVELEMETKALKARVGSLHQGECRTADGPGGHRSTEGSRRGQAPP